MIMKMIIHMMTVSWKVIGGRGVGSDDEAMVRMITGAKLVNSDVSIGVHDDNHSYEFDDDDDDGDNSVPNKYQQTKS